MNSTDSLSDEYVIHLARDIARGMLHLHAALVGTPIIHKDLASRNILVTLAR